MEIIFARLWGKYSSTEMDLRENRQNKAAVHSPIGYLPENNSIDLFDLEISNNDFEELLSVKNDLWLDEVNENREYYKIFKDRLPEELIKELNSLESRLVNPQFK